MRLLLWIALWISPMAVIAADTNAPAPATSASASNNTAQLPGAKPVTPPVAAATQQATATNAPTPAAPKAANATIQAPAAPDPLSETVAAAPPPEDANGPPPQTAKPSKKDIEFAHEVETGAQQRIAGNYDVATRMLVGVLENNAPAEVQRRALLELAQTAQDHNEWVKAQQIYSQYLHRYPEDETVPGVLLRQGLLYRRMGVNTLAYSKFYAVMSSALKLKLGDIDYYKDLVMQAQMEIAETYYQDGKYEYSADFFARILKSDMPVSDPEQVQLKLTRSLSYLTNYAETIARSEMFLRRYSNSVSTAEVRFILASALQQVGRSHDSMMQVLLLLQAQQENIKKDPETWVYWQRRAGNEIANLLYKEGNYLEALDIYQNLANLNTSADWQVPVWYQVGLVFEQLQQWQKAVETYNSILNRQKETDATNTTPTLTSLFQMAKWRKDYVIWMEKASAENLALFQSATNTFAPAKK